MEEATKNVTALIYSKMMAIMKDMTPIAKDRKNEAQHYNFRGIDDVYNLVQPILAKHGVFMTCELIGDSSQERESKSGSALFSRALKLRYRFIASDGSQVTTEVVGEGMDSGDKAANKAMSVGQKYAILQTFLIPTDEPKDPENDNPEPTPKPKATISASPHFPTATESQFSHLDEFAKAKKNLGDEEYYKILGNLGYEHANEIPVEIRQNTLATMRTRFKELKPKKQGT